MSSKLKADGKAATKKPTLFEQIADKTKALAELAAKKKGVAGVAILLLAVFMCHFSSVLGAAHAALYIFANNGKVSGRMSGDVKMRNGRQRGFSVPALVRNSFTSAVRTRFQTFSSAYKSLTALQIDSWVNAVGFSYIDRFAVSHVLKGKALYMRLNMNLDNAGIAPIATAPLATGVLAIEFIGGVASIAGTQLDLIFAPATIPVGLKVIVYATTSLNAGIRRPGNSLFRQIGTIDAGGTSPFDAWTVYTTKFGIPVLDATVFLRFVTINKVTGEASAISQSDVLILA